MSKIDWPIMPYHGGKWRLAPWVISHFPVHRIYVEPFGGAASVLMRKPRSFVEVYNDLDRQMVNVMQVLQDEVLREELAAKLFFTPYARAEFKQARDTTESPIELARRTLIRAYMGFGSAGATQKSSGFRSYVKQGTHFLRWPKLPYRIHAFSARLQGVIIEEQPALQILQAHDTPETLFYIDPPYLHATRQIKGGCYRHEMNDEQHAELLDVLRSLQGMVILSGYPNSLYDACLKGWHRVEKPALISAQRGASWRTEVLWLSPNIKDAMPFLTASQDDIGLPKRAKA